MTNDSQFVKVKASIDELFERIHEQPSSVRDKLKEKVSGPVTEITKATEKLSKELDKYFEELDAIKAEQLNERIAKLDAFCKAHEGTSFSVLEPYTVDVTICDKTYAVDVYDDEYLGSNLQKIDNLLKISKQLDEAGVNHRLKKNHYPFGRVYDIRIILDKFAFITLDFSIDNDNTVKLKAQYCSDSIEYLKRHIDPLTTFEAEVGTRDHEEMYVTITSTNQCKLEDVAIKMQQLAEHVSDNIDFKAE